ncbi:MAG: hypothetical protein GXZ11_07070 [Tissierellia bacterium]|nr:hypothetical protein [Tissierellia bacterium]
MGKLIAKRVYCLAIVLLIMVLAGCQGQADNDYSNVESLFQAMFKVTDSELGSFQSTDHNNLAKVFEERFSPWMTKEYYALFLKNRQCDFFLNCITERYTSIVDLKIDVSDEKENAYNVYGEGSYKDNADVNHQFSFVAYVETLGEDEQRLVNYIKFIEMKIE